MKIKSFVLAFLASIIFAPAGFTADACYESVLIPASNECSDDQSSSADFTSGCRAVPAHYEQQEVECKIGRWVNVVDDTRLLQNTKVLQSSYGNSPTHADLCARYDLKPAASDGKTCASGERPARQGTGWQSINYKYGFKGGGNGNVGGDKVEGVFFGMGGTGPGPDYFGDSSDGNAPAEIYIGTMCYDYSMGKKHHTPEDAVVAVFCE